MKMNAVNVGILQRIDHYSPLMTCTRPGLNDKEIYATKEERQTEKRLLSTTPNVRRMQMKCIRSATREREKLRCDVSTLKFVAKIRK